MAITKLHFWLDLSRIIYKSRLPRELSNDNDKPRNKRNLGEQNAKKIWRKPSRFGILEVSKENP